MKTVVKFCVYMPWQVEHSERENTFLMDVTFNQ